MLDEDIKKFYEEMILELDTKKLIKDWARAMFSGKIPIDEDYVKYGDAFIPIKRNK